MCSKPKPTAALIDLLPLPRHRRESASGRQHEYKRMPESGCTGDQHAQPQPLARFQSVPKFPARHPPRCRGIGPYFPVWNGQAIVELHAGSSSACRSGLPSFSAWNAFHRPTSQGRQIRPSGARSVHIGALRHGVTSQPCSGTGTDRFAGEIFPARLTLLTSSVRLIRTALAAAFSSGSPWRGIAPGSRG